MTSLEEAIALSQRRAKHFWLVSVAWVLIMSAVAVIFGISIVRFERTSVDLTNKIESMQQRLRNQQERAESLIFDLERIKDNLSFLKIAAFYKLSEGERQSYVLNLQIKDDFLDPEEKEIVRGQANRLAKEEPTANSLTIQAFSQYLDGDYGHSFDTYATAIDREPKLVYAYMGRALPAVRLKKLQEAYDDLTKAHELSSNDFQREKVLLRRAEVLARLGKSNEAEKDLAEADRLTINHAGVLNKRGLVALLSKDWQGAENNFRQASELATGTLKAAYLENIGLIYLHQSKWTEAYSWTIELTKSSSGAEWTPMIQALAAEKLGNRQVRDESVKIFIQRNYEPREDLADLASYLPDDLAQLAGSWIK
jgi:tetratricopeptide (TPR) repeat protein